MSYSIINPSFELLFFNFLRMDCEAERLRWIEDKVFYYPSDTMRRLPGIWKLLQLGNMASNAFLSPMIIPGFVLGHIVIGSTSIYGTAVAYEKVSLH